MKHPFRIIAVCSALSLSACAETQFLAQAGKMFGGENTESAETISPMPPGTQYKVGKPYQVNGRWYYPKEDWDYAEEGTASWYGDEFHGRKTANGEIFSKDALTAAHPTLPMPSLVRVTNLDNGRTATLRVNDRGPFKKGRIIDVSHASARVLGFESEGMARVRVELLSEESKRLAALAGAKLPDKLADATGSGDPLVQIQSSRVEGEGKPLLLMQSEELAPLDLPPANASGGIALSESKLMAPSNTAEPDAPTKILSPISPSNGIFLQVGSFSRLENVERLKTRLKSLAQIQVTPLERKGKTLYRVRMGPFESRDAALDLKSKVAGLGISDAKIVIE